MADLFKALTEASVDNLFIVAGLAFLAVAILGDISGKIHPGRFGRIASAILGTCFIVAGLWMHSGDRFAIKSFEIRAPDKAYVGRCPVRVEFTGIIEAEGSGTIVYSFAYSDGSETSPSEVKFDKSDTKVVRGVWQVQKSVSAAEARLKILAPEEKQTADPAIVSVTCEAETPSGPQSGTPSPARPSVLAVPRLRAPLLLSPISMIDQFVGTWRNAAPKPGELQTVEIKKVDTQTAQVALTGPNGSFGGGQYSLRGAELVFFVEKFGGMTQVLYRQGDHLILDQRFNDLPANLANRPDLAPRIVLERIQ